MDDLPNAHHKPDGPIVNMRIGNLALGPMPRTMLPLLQRWFNDADTLHTAGIGVTPWTIEMVTGWYERVTVDPHAAWFAIYEDDAAEPIGFAGLRDIYRHERTCEYAITIGAASARGKGYGTAVTRLMVEYAFTSVGLESVFLDTVEYNIGGIRAYEKAGFREIGRRRRVAPMHGRLWDLVYMECVKADGAGEKEEGTGGERRQQHYGLLPPATSDHPISQSPDSPPLLVRGALVVLGPADKAQLPNYARWFSDMQTMRTQGDPEPAPRTVEELETWYDSEMSGKEDRIWFSVYELTTMRHIGFVDLHHIDHRNRSATMSLMVGEPDARGRGYGSEMARLIVEYGAQALSLQNIALEVYEYNPAGMRAYQKAGFREFARRRQAHHMGGRLWDIVLMEWLPDPGN